MKDWIRISLHLSDYGNGKKESGGISVFDWVDLADWDLLQIWVGMTCCMFHAIWRNDHLLSFPRFWLDFHHFRCGSSLFPCSHSDNALSNAAEWALRWMGSGCCGCVAQREESRASWWSVEVVLKSADVYSWERDEGSTSSDCNVTLVAECLWKIHIGETGHV